MKIAIKNVRVVQLMAPVEVLEGVDVLIDGTTISKVAKGAAAGFKADKVIDGTGLTLMPGNVCGHHHYYSELARGMQISAGPQTDLITTLKEWWWRLDRALDEKSLYWGSLACSLDAIAAGTTSCIDHHESPNYIDGSLSVIAKGMEEVGLRGLTAYGITARNYGMDEIKKGNAEGIRFAKEVDARKKKGEDVLCEAMLGAHAPFTVPNEGYELLSAAAKETGRGVHIHVAEGEYDVVHEHHFYDMDIVARLKKFHLLNGKTLLAHGVFLSEGEIEEANKAGAWLTHQARSNMNNQIGYAKLLPQVNNLIIGTDGCGGNMYEELKCAFFKHRDAKGQWWPSNFVEALTRGNRFLEVIFPGKKFGRVEAGYMADLQLLDYQSPTPILPANAAGHFVWGMASGHVKTVIVNGKVVMENREFVGIDKAEIYAKAQEEAVKMWKRADALKASGI